MKIKEPAFIMSTPFLFIAASIGFVCGLLIYGFIMGFIACRDMLEE